MGLGVPQVLLVLVPLVVAYLVNLRTPLGVWLADGGVAIALALVAVGLGLVVISPAHAVRVAAGSPLLANRRRHAPGSPVRIQALRHGEHAVVRVCDVGPGPAPGAERGAFEFGVRGARSTGQGLGLHICRELVEGEADRIWLEPRPVAGTGCTVGAELPVAFGRPDRGGSSLRSRC